VQRVANRISAARSYMRIQRIPRASPKIEPARNRTTSVLMTKTYSKRNSDSTQSSLSYCVYWEPCLDISHKRRLVRFISDASRQNASTGCSQAGASRSDHLLAGCSTCICRRRIRRTWCIEVDGSGDRGIKTSAVRRQERKAAPQRADTTHWSRAPYAVE